MGFTPPVVPSGLGSLAVSTADARMPALEQSIAYELPTIHEVHNFHGGNSSLSRGASPAPHVVDPPRGGPHYDTNFIFISQVYRRKAFTLTEYSALAPKQRPFPLR